MGKRGPKPIPTALKKLAGNPGKRALPENEPQYEVEIPDCPEHLDEVAKAEWERMAKAMHAAGVLTKADRAVMAAYCESWSLYVRASVDVQTYGTVLVSPKSGLPFASPHLNVMTTAMKQLRAYAVELGLSPSSRAGVTAVGVDTSTSADKTRFLKLVG